MEFVSEDMQKGMFQATLAAAIESTFTIRVRNTICALGSRGDYIEAVMFCSAGTATNVPINDTLYVELVDYTGVPAIRYLVKYRRLYRLLNDWKRQC
jgi:hypothetical protein